MSETPATPEALPELYNPAALKPKQHLLLQEIRRNGGYSTVACTTIGICYNTMYRWREGSPAFKRAFDLCMEEGKARLIDQLQREAFRRGHDGVEEPVFFMGKEVAKVRKYSDALLTSMLKAKVPDFRDRLEMAGHLALGQMSEEDLRAELAALLAEGFLALPEPQDAPEQADQGLDTPEPDAGEPAPPMTLADLI